MRKPREKLDGAWKTTEYRIWQGIKSRCSNPNDPRFKWYGARGILLCEVWRNSFLAFREHVGLRPSLRHSLDRINNDRGYEPGNVRWALGSQQQRNSRSSRVYELDGQVKTLTEWVEGTSIPYDVVRQRVEKYRWPLRDALTRPVGGGGKYATAEKDEYERLYLVWWAMVSRCHDPTNKRYHAYGGRGVVVCDKWRTSYDRFFADLDPRPTEKHTIDRIDNSKGYEPGNIRWATATEQNRNRRSTRMYEFDGEQRPLAEWAELAGIPYGRVKQRVVTYRWPLDEALGTPIGFGRCPASERKKWNGRPP